MGVGEQAEGRGRDSDAEHDDMRITNVASSTPVARPTARRRSGITCDATAATAVNVASSSPGPAAARPLLGRMRPSSRRSVVDLPAPLGAQVAEHLAAAHLQVKPVQRDKGTESLGQLLGDDGWCIVWYLGCTDHWSPPDGIHLQLVTLRKQRTRERRLQDRARWSPPEVQDGILSRALLGRERVLGPVDADAGLKHAQKVVLPLWQRTKIFRAYSSWLIPGAVHTAAYTTAVLRAIAVRRNLPDATDEAAAVRDR